MYSASLIARSLPANLCRDTIKVHKEVKVDTFGLMNINDTKNTNRGDSPLQYLARVRLMVSFFDMHYSVRRLPIKLELEILFCRTGTPDVVNKEKGGRYLPKKVCCVLTL
jgi:hypothetical protein